MTEAFRALTKKRASERRTLSQELRTAALALLAMALLFALDQSLVNWFGHGRG